MTSARVIEVPRETTNYVRQSFEGQWHIAQGHGRKPSAKALCGIKRINYWADTAVTRYPNLCAECEAKS